MTFRMLAPCAGAAFMLLGFAGGASAYQCKPTNQSAISFGQTHPMAQAVGRGMWTSKVKNSLGLEWSVWSIAANGAQSCVAVSGGFQCTTIAKPCKYVVQ
jgi:hypothetical protein